jgi:Carboxypeptidase regulatory-like domain
MSLRAHKTVAGFVGGIILFSLPLVSEAASLPKLSGEISGMVTDTSGVPQMGATVLLYTRQARLFQRALTNERGTFAFAGLLPDLYSLRVSLSSFVPAIRGDILVEPGMRSVLNVSLATLFSTIQVVPLSAQQRTLMSDEWKWVLRTSAATRPVLRFLPAAVDVSQGGSRHASVFSDTRGVLKVSAADGGLASGSSADLGTAFALATSLYGSNQLQFSGNVGYAAQTGMPSAAFRTSYTRTGAPEVSLTMRQLYLPGRFAESIAGPGSSLPALRTMSLNFGDHTELSDNLSMDYGFSLDSVSFMDRLNYFSPYARFTYTLDDATSLVFTYTSGNARPDIGLGPSGPEAGLQRDLNALSMFPRISLLAGRAKVQRGEDFELAYKHKLGSREVELSAYRESVSNAALTVSSPEGLYTGGDILPDLFSGSSIFNAGDYQTNGYTASFTQNAGDHLSATVMYGSGGVLTAERRTIESANPDDLRSMIRASRRHAVTARVSGVAPYTGTHFIASYQWADNRLAVTPGHLYSTQSMRPVPGLNLYIRQPLPTYLNLPWRMEATADLRNLLAQGYLPLGLSDGRQLLLMQTPRSFRGGLSFIF